MFLYYATGAIVNYSSLCGVCVVAALPPAPSPCEAAALIMSSFSISCITTMNRCSDFVTLVT